MSSGRFETELRPDKRLRRLVMACGSLCLLTGVVIVIHLPLTPMLRLMITCLWVWQSARDLHRQARGAARIRRLTVRADGTVSAHNRSGGSERLRLLTGSVVLERLAWLRLGFDDGRNYGELLAGDPVLDRNWHGLLLIWRQCRGAFGRDG